MTKYKLMHHHKPKRDGAEKENQTKINK